MIDFWQDYRNLIKPKEYNWVSFTVLHFYWEIEFGVLYIELGLLGFNTRISFVVNKKENKKVDKLMKEVGLK